MSNNIETKLSVSDIVANAISEYERGNYNIAKTLYESTLRNTSFTDKGIIYYNIGLCHFSLMNYEDAEIAFATGFYNYFNHNCGYELSMSMLHNNKLREGMNLYQYRYYGNRNNFPNLPIEHVLSIEECRGKNVLVMNEQGYGDEIMFSRGIYALAEVATRVQYQVYEKMQNLFSSQYQCDNVTFTASDKLSYEMVMQYDCWISSGDVFSSYLKSNGMELKTFKTKHFNTDRFRIGITWAANAISKSSGLRTLSVDAFKLAIDDGNTEIVSLQMDSSLPWMSNPDISNFEKTFDEIEKVDFVITVDTVTAHLSGMMGKPTLLVYDVFLDWRWVYKLYPSVKIVNISELNEAVVKMRKKFKRKIKD